MKSETFRKILGIFMAAAITIGGGFSAKASEITDDETQVSEEYTVDTETDESTEAAVNNIESLGVGSFKSFMDYRAISAVGSVQYELQQSAVTGEYGIRTYNGRFMVAVASTFGQAGDSIDVVLENGTVLPCVIGDIKAGTALMGGDGSVVEFIVDTPHIPSEVMQMGSFHVIFPGNVASIN